MDLEDKLTAKVSGLQSLSSSVQSTPEKNGHSDDASRSGELVQEFVKSGPTKELQSCIDKERKHLKTSNKSLKNKDQRKPFSDPNNKSSSKKQRKGETPIRLPQATNHSLDFGCSKSWVCKNSACRAVLSIDDTFCKRCSCCICHLFDDNKDPSLWLECTSESAHGYSCGLSCHMECALERRKVGVVDLGQLMQLDGSYCCASCGKVSGVLGSLKKQLVIAKDARRVDILCYRIFLCFRLLDGTSRFKELHEITNVVKSKLEGEVGPLNGISAKMARGIVSRLSIAGDVQELCSIGIDKADEWLANISNSSSYKREDSLPAACEFMFEEVASSSVVIVLIELSNAASDTINGYKLWYCNSREETYTKEPTCVFPKSQRRILVSNLQPCTEYTFRVISHTEDGDLGHSEAKCFTKSVEIIHKNINPLIPMNCKIENISVEENCAKREPKKTTNGSFSEFKVRNLGKVLHTAHGRYENCCEEIKSTMSEPVEAKHLPSFPLGLDLNVVSVPDLNEELTPPFESSRDEDTCNIGKAVEAENDDVGSHDINKIGVVRSHGSDNSQISTRGLCGQVPTIDSREKLCTKRTNEDTHECDSILINGSAAFRVPNESGCLDENFEYCVKMIRWLECEGHIKQDFRLKLLTWYSLRSTEQERRVVNTFIQTLIDDPTSLAGQLVDSFSDIVSNKKPRNGFCSRLWH